MRLVTIRSLAVMAAVPILALGLGGCASGGPPERPPFAGRTPSRGAQDVALAHFLSRVTFGASPEDLAEVGRTGAEAFLDRQMHPARIDDSSLERQLAGFETLRLSSRDIVEQYYQPAIEARRAMQAAAAVAPGLKTAGPQPQGLPPSGADAFRKERVVLQELSDQRLLRAVYSARQFQEVLVDFWFNHFNVFVGKGADRGLITGYERDVIRPHVFGTFRELLGATAQSPAMLFYLDNWMSVDTWVQPTTY